jgi:hypothetical protein
VQRLERDVVDLEARLLEGERERENHQEKEEQWRVEVRTISRPALAHKPTIPTSEQLRSRPLSLVHW